VGTDVVGAKVEIANLDLDMPAGDVTMRGLTVANPFEPMKNLFEADEVTFNIDPVPLLEKKLIIDRVAILGMRFGTGRETPGVIENGEQRGRANEVMQQIRAWGERLDVPVLQLARGRMDIDTLDPTRLESLRLATTLAARAESSAAAWRAATEELDVQPVIDSSRALIERLRRARPTDLGLINDTRRTIQELRQTRDTVVALQRSITGGLDSLKAGLQALEGARRRDYAMARGLMRLPSFDPPDIAAALFAPVAIRQFEQAMYWAQKARHYMPPGLLPRATGGPNRVRRSGTTVRFPRERDYPTFLLREAEISAVLGSGSNQTRKLAGRLSGLTSAPAIYGRPTVFEASAPRVRVGAMLDHVGEVVRDTAGAELSGLELPAFGLPGLPFRVEPGTGTTGLRVLLRDGTIRAAWSINADRVRWLRDTTSGSEIERIVGRVLSRITSLTLSAELSGPVAGPTLSVRSNLDRAISGALRETLGEEVAAAERRLRAEVDRLVAERAGPVRERIAEIERDITARVNAELGSLQEVQAELEQRVRELTRGLPLPL
jgi:uncharacterized protein (TIGR03545 family)